MRDKAGEGLLIEGQHTDPLFMMYVALGWRVTESGTIYMTADNVLDEKKVVARRPYGARPSKPRRVMVGLKLVL